MWEQFSKGLTKTRILPGSDTSSIPKPESVDYLSHLNPNYSECKDYVNTDTDEHTVKEVNYKKVVLIYYLNICFYYYYFHIYRIMYIFLMFVPVYYRKLILFKIY